ncbi:hypothetical protein V0288_01985 [Pannus brasiliensis CCIBt3594]|uniref:Uncharacterized protein n=1 Tax=Pannus brasiliensis CCIBt3594 TaxID=1427578 RepID=A0AAW9QFV3_9CHRO
MSSGIVGLIGKITLDHTGKIGRPPAIYPWLVRGGRRQEAGFVRDLGLPAKTFPFKKGGL